MPSRFIILILLSLLLFNACKRSASVSGVWREIEEQENDKAVEITDLPPAIYELNLGQYGDRVAGVSVRYKRPSEDSLALFDPADRCNCSFVVQGLIEELNDSDDRELLFIANGLTFSLYTPTQKTTMAQDTPEVSSSSNQPCAQINQECKRIFNLEQVDGGDRLSGFTWCIEEPDKTRRPILFEAINGLTEDSCESE